MTRLLSLIVTLTARAKTRLATGLIAAGLALVALPLQATDTGAAAAFDEAPGWSFFCTYNDKDGVEASFVLISHRDLPRTPLMILPDNTEIPATILPGDADQSPFLRTFQVAPRGNVARMITVTTSTNLAFYSEHVFSPQGAWRFSAEARCESQPLAAKEN